MEIPATQFPLSTSPSSGKGALPPKVQASYTDILSQELQKQDPTAEITYVVSVQNESGRSAGLSNQVQVPSAPTRPPPEHFRAQVKSDGVLVSWDCSPTVAASDRIEYKLRIYRREQGKPADAKVSDANLTDCAQSQPAQAPEFLDQTFEWEKHYDYRAAVDRRPMACAASVLMRARSGFASPLPSGCTRFVNTTEKRSLSGSIHSAVPVNPR